MLLTFMLLNGIPVILLHSWLMICGSLKGHVMCAELPLFCSNIMSTSLLPRLWQLWPCKGNIRPYFVHNIEVSQAACCTVYVKFEDKQESCGLRVLFYRLTVLRFFFYLCQSLMQSWCLPECLTMVRHPELCKSCCILSRALCLKFLSSNGDCFMDQILCTEQLQVYFWYFIYYSLPCV